MTAAFLDFSKSGGNDLSTPVAGKPARTHCWATNCGHHSNGVIYGYTP
jgi:uncharacterized protein (DUF2237 family)